MNVLELFAGIGGMALGLERAGMKATGFVEINPWCRKVLAKHWPEVPQHDDVRTAVEWWTGQPRPPVDLVAGGYPCQPESNAGKGLGTADSRWLWPEMARVIHALRPRYVIGENVMGHRTRGLRFVLRDLADLGYTARAGTLEAREVGAPHIRRRIFTLAERTDLADAGGEPRNMGHRPDQIRGRAGKAEQTRLGGSALADTEREPWDARRAGDAGQGARGRNADRGGIRADQLADAERDGRIERTGARGDGAGWPEPADHGWWAAEPAVGRVAHGISRRVDRLRGLGNAVVPQVAERIGRILISGAWRDA